MPIWRADRARIYAQEETTYGTDPLGTRTVLGGLIRDVEYTAPTQTWLTYPSVGTDRHYAVVARGQTSMAEIRVPIVLQTPKIFRYLFEGRRTVADNPSTGYNTHIYSPVGEESTKGDLSTTLATQVQPLLSFTLETSYEDPTSGGTGHFTRYYNGCKVSSLELSMDSSGELLATANLTAASVYSNSTRTTSTIATTRPYMFYDAQVRMFGTSATQAGTGIMTLNNTTTYERISDFSVTVENNIKQNWYLTTATDLASGTVGGRYIYDLVPGIRDITGTVGLILDTEDSLTITGGSAGANTVFGRHEGAGTTPFDMEITLTRTTGQDVLRLQFFDAWITRAPHNIPEDKADIPVEIEFGARKMRVEVVNNLATGGMAF